MADNVAITAGSGTTIAADDIGGVLHQRVKISVGADGAAADLAAGSAAAAASLPTTLSTEDVAILNAIKTALEILDDADRSDSLKVVGHTIDQAASSTVQRPADTTAYAIGDLIANSTTAGSVNALQFTTAARISGGSGAVVGAKVQKSTNVTTNVAMRLHMFNTIPTFTSAGDNSAMTSVVQASAKGYLGYIDIPTFVGFQDVAWGTGAPDNARGSLPFVATAQILYGILEARGAFTPGNAEVFTVSIFALQD